MLQQTVGVILQGVLYLCRSRSLKLRENRRSMLFNKDMLKTKSGLK